MGRARDPLDWRRPCQAKAIRRAFKEAWCRVFPYCAYCLRWMRFEQSTVDHVIPTCKGGLDLPSNWVACCAACNTEKASKKRTPAVGPVELDLVDDQGIPLFISHR